MRVLEGVAWAAFGGHERRSRELAGRRPDARHFGVKVDLTSVGQARHLRVEPGHLRSFATFAGAHVIATGCDTGHPELVEAVLDCGAASYLAPDSSPFWYASFFAPVFLFYELAELRSLTQAVDRLVAHDDELGAWQLHVPTASDRQNAGGPPPETQG